MDAAAGSRPRSAAMVAATTGEAGNGGSPTETEPSRRPLGASTMLDERSAALSGRHRA
jgi:hypothetical protein